jgi:hypothetical protein
MNTSNQPIHTEEKNMPVDLKTLLEKGEAPSGPREAKIKPAVTKFLQENPTQAFTVAELADLVEPGNELNKQTINQVVRNLEKEGLVVRRTVPVPGSDKKSLIYVALAPEPDAAN